MRFGTILWLAAALSVAAVTNDAAARDFIRANGNEPATLDPQQYEKVSENMILRDLFEGLTTQDANNRIVPGQAERWDISEDGLTWTFHLRPGLKWSDGTPLTADDFVAGLRRAADPRTAAKLPDLIYKIANARAIVEGRAAVETLGVAAPDANTVVVTLAAPSPLVPETMALSICVPVPRHVIDKVGQDWVRAEHMVTNGAYRLVSWSPSTSVRIERNPHFRDAASVAIDAVQFLPSDQQEAALKRYRAGEIDMLPAVPADQIGWAKRTLADQLTLVPVTQVRYLEINHAKAALQDVRVRRALALAIDREIIATKIMSGAALPAYGFVPRAIEGYEGAVFDFAAQPQAERRAEALRLLAEAGYGPDRPLAIELRILADSWAQDVAVGLMDMWRKVGVKVMLKSADSTVHFAAVNGGDYDIALTGWFGTDDPETFAWLFQQNGGMNESGYGSAAFDAVRTEAEQTMDRTQRYARFAAAEKILLNDVAMLPLFWTIQPVLISPEVKGFAALPTGLTRSQYAGFGR